MKRFLILLLAALVLLPVVPSLAEDFVLEGLVTELTDDGFVMEDLALGKVQVLVREDTLLEGMLADEPVCVGQYVIVVYGGRLTRSIPPQASADKVSCFYVKGTASEMTNDSILITGDERWGDVYAALGESAPAIHKGDLVTVYFNGVMALSLPARIGGLHVALSTVTGTVSELSEQRFLLTTESGEHYEVLMDENTQRFALDDGQTVTVTYSGQTTKSLPAQLTAYTVDGEGMGAQSF